MRALQIKAGSMSAGEFHQLRDRAADAVRALKRLTGIHNIFQQALGPRRVSSSIWTTEGIAREADCGAACQAFENAIRVRQRAVSVTRRRRTGFCSTSIDLEVKAGEVVALVGPSGGGQDDARQPGAALLRRHAAARSRIDGRDVRDLNLASLRDQIGIVAQDTFLFNDTVANNIAYGRPDASARGRLQAAAETALADEFIARSAGRVRDDDRRARIEAERRPAAAAWRSRGRC